MSEWTLSVSSNSGQDTLHGGSIYLTNLDEWRHTQMYPNNSGYRPMAQQGATPISNLHHNYNPINNQTFPGYPTNMQLTRQQVSNQNHYLRAEQQAHHQNFQQHLHQRSSRIMGQAPLVTERHNKNVFQHHLEVNTLHPTPNTSSLILPYNDSFQSTGTAECSKNTGKYLQMAEKTFYAERKRSDDGILQIEAYLACLNRTNIEIQGEKNKLKDEKQALANKVESLEVELSELQDAFKERNIRFDNAYGEVAQEAKVAKDELEKKSTCLARAKLRAEKKDAELVKIQNKLRDVRIAQKQSRKVLKKLREIVKKRDAEIIELKSENSKLKSNMENCEEESKKLKDQVAKLECDVALNVEHRKNLKVQYIKLLRRELKKQRKKMNRLVANNLSKGRNRSKSSEQHGSSRKMRKLGGKSSQVDQGSGGAGATTEKLQKKRKNGKWNIKNYFITEKNNLYHYNTSDSSNGEMGVDESEDTCQQETGDNKNGDEHKKRVYSIAKTRLPQWKHLLQSGDSSLVTVRQDCKQLGSNFRKK